MRQVNGRKVDNTRGLQDELNSAGNSWAITIQRGGQTVTVRYSS